MYPVDRLAGAAQRGHLLGGLASPQRMQDGAGRHLLRAGQRGPQPQRLHRPHPVVDRDPGGGRHRACDQPVRIVRLGPGQHVQAERADRRGQRGGPLQQRHHQHRLAAGRYHQAGQPLQRDRVISGQVAQVRAGCDEQRVHPPLGRGLRGAGEPFGEGLGCERAGHGWQGSGAAAEPRRRQAGQGTTEPGGRPSLDGNRTGTRPSRNGSGGTGQASRAEPERRPSRNGSRAGTAAGALAGPAGPSRQQAAPPGGGRRGGRLR